MEKHQKLLRSMVSTVLAVVMICTTIPLSVISEPAGQENLPPTASEIGETDSGNRDPEKAEESQTPKTDEGQGTSPQSEGTAQTVVTGAEGEKSETGTKGVTGAKGGSTGAFVPPVTFMTATAYKLSVSGNGSTSMDMVSNTTWNSTSNSGVYFYYMVGDSAGNYYSNNPFTGRSPLPSGAGTVSYAYIYYAEDPSKGGRELSNVVPVGTAQSAWLAALHNYEKNPANLKDGAIDYTELLLNNLSWVASSNTTLPLAATMGGAGSLVYEPQYYSVFLKWEMDGCDPVISTNNSVVYVHDSSSGGGTGTGTGEGGTGTGEGGSTSTFVGPASAVYANPYQMSDGSYTLATDVEYDDVSESGVWFYYGVRDANYAPFGTIPGQTPLGSSDGQVQYVYVYSDTATTMGVSTFCPVGMTLSAWQSVVSKYAGEYGAAHPREPVNYDGLLATLVWTSASNNHLQVYSDNAVYGTTGGTTTYSPRYYSVFVRWTDGVNTVYYTSNPTVFLHQSPPPVPTSPVSSASAAPYWTTSSGSLGGSSAILPKTSTATNIDFRYAFTDAYNITWSNQPGAINHPVDPSLVRIEYLWTYTDKSNQGFVGLPAGYVPVGMSALEWNTMRNDYMSTWRDPSSPIDYSNLVIDLSGWTTDPNLPLFDDEAVYGVGNGEKGKLTSRYYSCMVRVTFLDGSGYRKAFLTGSSVLLKFGTVGALNMPFTVNSLTGKRYSGGAYQDWSSVTVTAHETYTPVRFAYSITDDIGQEFRSFTNGYSTVPYGVTVNYLWAEANLYEIPYPPGIHKVPIGMTRAEWEAMLEGKTEADYPALLASLSGWTTDPRLPVFHGGTWYGAFMRVSISGVGDFYYWDGAVVYEQVLGQSGPGTLADYIANTDSTHLDQVTLSAPVSVSGVSVSYQWYECSGPNDTYGTPIPGATTSTYTIDYTGSTFDRYLYMRYQYTSPSGSVVSDKTNIGHYLLTNAPVGTVEASNGRNYYFDGFTPYGITNPGYYEYEYNGGQLQVVGSVGKLAARWLVNGNCSRMTYQWYETDASGNHIAPVGSLYVVNDPFEYGTEVFGYNRKADISITCPSDTVGTKYYRVVVTNYEPGGASFTCESNVVTVTTLPAANREDLFEIDENGRLTAYHGFEDEVVIPQSIQGIAVTAIASYFAAAVNMPRVVLPEGVITIENYAFREAHGLREIVLPSTLQYIGIGAFQRCGLTSLTIPESVQVIQKDAFRYAFTDTAEVTVNAEDVIVVKGAFHMAEMQKIVFNSTVSLTLNAIEDGENNFIVQFNIVSPYMGCFDECPNLYYFAFPSAIDVITDGHFASYEQNGKTVEYFQPVYGYAAGGATIYNCPNLTWVENYNSIYGNNKTLGICNSTAKCLINEGAVRIGDWIVVEDHDLSVNPYYFRSPTYNDNPNGGWRVVKKLFCDDTVVTLPETLDGKTVTGWGGSLYYSFCSRVWANVQYNTLENRHVDLTDSPETLTEVILPATIRNISDYCCTGYTALTTVNFEDCPDLRSIGMQAFEGTPLSGSLILPGDHYCFIGSSAFYNTNLTYAYLEKAVIFPWAFDLCYQLATVEGEWETTAYSRCYTMLYLVPGTGTLNTYNFFHLVPAFPDQFNYAVFGGTSVTDENAERISKLNGVYIGRIHLFDKYWWSGTEEDATIRYYVGVEDTEVIMPALLVDRPAGLFININTVSIDDGIMKADYHMTVCAGIETVEGTYHRMTSVDLPEGLITFGHAFADSSLLTEIYIPSTVTAIEDYAFCFNGLYNYDSPDLQEVTFAPDSQCTSIGKNAFKNQESLTEIILPEGVTSIGSSAFAYCESLENIVLSDSLETIGENAFRHCESLTEILFPSNLHYIGREAFDSSAIGNFVLPSSLWEIGSEAFTCCDNLTAVTVPDSVQFIGENAFSHCENLESATLPNGLTEVAAGLFYCCESLTTVNIPTNCKVIRNGAFQHCESLQFINIPFGVSIIEDYAFEDTGINWLDIPVSVDRIGNRIIKKNSNYATISFLSHSAHLPIFEPESYLGGIPNQYFNRIYGHPGSGAYHIAQVTGTPFSYQGINPDYDYYRLIEMFDYEGNPVSSADVISISWYDVETGNLIYSGTSVEIPSAYANINKRIRCFVTFKPEFVVRNLTEQTVSYDFAIGEKTVIVNFQQRPTIQIEFTPPTVPYGCEFLLTIERPDGDHHYVGTNTVIEGNPGFRLITEWFPTTLTVWAENCYTRTITGVEGASDDDTVRDLGEIELLPCGPRLHYTVSYYDTDGFLLFEDENLHLYGTFTLYNETKDTDVTAYMTFEANTYLTITNDAADPGDRLCLKFNPTRYTYSNYIDPITFTVPWATGSVELSTTFYRPGRLRLNANRNKVFVFDEEDVCVATNAAFEYAVEFIPGTYRVVALKNVPVGIKIENRSDIVALGVAEEKVYETIIFVYSGIETTVSIPTLEEPDIPELSVLASVDERCSTRGYIPVTIRYAYDEASVSAQKRIVITVKKSDFASDTPFMSADGRRVWLIDGVISTGDIAFVGGETSIGNTLTIPVQSLSGTFIIYAVQDSEFSVRMEADDFAADYIGFTTPRLDGKITDWRMSSLPTQPVAEETVLRIPLYHPTIVQTYYFRAYNNGVLVEKTPGCGYTEIIHASAISETGTFTLPAGWVDVFLPVEHLPDRLNVCNYDFTISTSAEDHAIFRFGKILIADEGSEQDTLIFDRQTVKYLPESVLAPAAVRLDIKAAYATSLNSTRHIAGTAYFSAEGKDTPLLFTFLISHIPLNLVLDYSLTMTNPETVTGGEVILTVYYGGKNSEEVYDVKLHYNPVTGTYDGQLDLSDTDYTGENVPSEFYYEIDYDYELPEDDSLNVNIVTDDPGVTGSINAIESVFSENQTMNKADEEAFAPVDTEAFIAMVSAAFAGEEDYDELIETAYALCAYQNAMANNYAELRANLAALADSDSYAQAILTDGYLSATLLGIGNYETAVYEELEIDPELLEDDGFIAQTAASGNLYYVLTNERGTAFYDVTAQRLQITSYDKTKPMTFSAIASLLSPAKKTLMKKSGGAKGLFGDDINYALAAEDLRQQLNDLKEYYDGEFCDYMMPYKNFLNTALSYINNVKMFIDLALTQLQAVDEGKLNKFQQAAQKYGDLFLEASEKDIKINPALKQGSKTEYEKALEEAKKGLDQAFKELNSFRDRLKTLETGAITQNKTVSSVFGSIAKVSKGVYKAADKMLNYPGISAFMLVYDIIDGVMSIGEAYNTYLSQIKNNLSRMEWMVSRLEATPKGYDPEKGDYSDQYKECVRNCYDYSDGLSDLRGYISSGFAQSVVGFVTTIVADVLSNINPLWGLAAGVCDFTIDSVMTLVNQGFMGLKELKVDHIESLVASSCLPEKPKPKNEDDSGKNKKNTKTHKTKFHLDPAGYVYEAVASNRVEGVTVTCYYKDDDGNAVLWNAAEADQVNPLVTDENGEYQWFVPMGEWKVIAEKEGYLTANSENDPAAVNGWLPVPPPQMNVYIPIVSTALPTVTSVQVGADYIRVEFSQYMYIHQLELYHDLITVLDGETVINCDYVFTDSEVSPTDPTQYYGRILLLTRHDGQKFTGNQLRVLVSSDFMNYAGHGMAEDYDSGVTSVGQIAGTLSHSYPNRFAGSIGEEADIVVYLQDTSGKPMAGATVTVSDNGMGTLRMPSSAVTDANGRAVFHTLVASSGSDILTFTCGEASVTLNTYVNPIGTVKPEKPTANLSDYQVVISGTQLVIDCATEGAVIRYTVNNSCPCDEEALVYDGPITITHDTFVRIAAYTEAGGYSERLNLHIRCLPAKAGDANGDGTIDELDLSAMRQALITDTATSSGLDANRDGVCDIRDLVRLKRHLTDGTPLGKTK